jgi:hypothetical protein
MAAPATSNTVRFPVDLAIKLQAIAWSERKPLSLITEQMFRSVIEQQYAALPASVRKHYESTPRVPSRRKRAAA